MLWRASGQCFGFRLNSVSFVQTILCTSGTTAAISNNTERLAQIFERPCAFSGSIVDIPIGYRLANADVHHAP